MHALFKTAFEISANSYQSTQRPAMENKNATRDRAPHIDAQLQQLSAYG